MSEKPLTERTPASLGLMLGVALAIIALLGCTASIGFGVWQCGKWIGEFQTKLDTIMLDIKIVKDTNTELRLKWDNHEARILKIETAGSPNLQKIQDQIFILQRTMELHIAKESKGTQ